MQQRLHLMLSQSSTHKRYRISSLKASYWTYTDSGSNADVYPVALNGKLKTISFLPLCNISASKTNLCAS